MGKNIDARSKVTLDVVLKVTRIVGVAGFVEVGGREGRQVLVFGGDGDLDGRAVRVLEDQAMEAWLHPLSTKPQPRVCCGLLGMCGAPCRWVQLVPWQQADVVCVGLQYDGEPVFAALLGTAAGEGVQLLQRGVVAQSAQLVELRRGDPHLPCPVAVEHLRGRGPLDTQRPMGST